ncbi:MAG: DNA-protecting protein DprA [Bacteroidales bacterium]|nr:DNA-protecting protein DprA [Bacteroidales bacterium]
MNRDQLVYAAAIANCFYGNPRVSRGLVGLFDSPSDIFTLDRKEVEERCPYLEKHGQRLFMDETLESAQRDIAWAENNGLDTIYIGDNAYPSRLRECEDAPILLYCKGRADLSAQRVVAVVGSRGATQYGRKYCDTLVEGLSKCGVKPVIVSGLAKGVDSFAHSSALRYHLPTVAVMGTGFNEIYPPCNTNLAADIVTHGGALVTEFSPFVESFPVNFVRRNRIIAGMSDCVVVVESRQKGGGLITAKMAMDYNRMVFAFPGRVDDYTFKGCNELIEQETACIATGAGSILKGMGWDTASAQLRMAFEDDSGGEDESLNGRLLRYLEEHGEADIGELCDFLALSIRELSLPLVELELEGRICVISGNKYSLR